MSFATAPRFEMQRRRLAAALSLVDATSGRPLEGGVRIVSAARLSANAGPQAFAPTALARQDKRGGIMLLFAGPVAGEVALGLAPSRPELAPRMARVTLVTDDPATAPASLGQPARVSFLPGVDYPQGGNLTFVNVSVRQDTANGTAPCGALVQLFEAGVATPCARALTNRAGEALLAAPISGFTVNSATLALVPHKDFSLAVRLDPDRIMSTPAAEAAEAMRRDPWGLADGRPPPDPDALAALPAGNLAITQGDGPWNGKLAIAAANPALTIIWTAPPNP